MGSGNPKGHYNMPEPKDAEGQEELDPQLESQEEDVEQEEEQGQANEDNQTNHPKGEEEDLIEIDGVNYTREEIKQGFMRQADYTRKTQEISNLRKENEGISGSQLNNQDPYSGYEPEQRQVLEFIDNRIKESISQAIKPLENEISDKEVRQEIDDTKKEFKLNDAQMQEVLAEADKLGANRLEPVIKYMMWDKKLQEVKEETEKQTKKNLMKRKAAITEGSEGGTGEPDKSKTDTTKMSYEEIADRVKSRI